jgi:elongation factor Tu
MTGPWMTIEDVFHIPRRGTVVTGQLQGSSPLHVGDTLVGGGGRWRVSGIEQFKAVLPAAMPGTNIGVLLKDGPASDVLRGQTVQFEVAGANLPVAEPSPKRRRWRR